MWSWEHVVKVAHLLAARKQRERERRHWRGVIQDIHFKGGLQ
jgi:hypothetical protein